MVRSDSRGWFKAAFGAHYRVLYKHRDEAEARSCLELLPKLAPLVKRAGELVLDLGCGDGRHAAWLQSSGVSVVGLDLSEDLLQAANQRATTGPLKLVRGDMRKLPFMTSTFGSVLSLFTAFGYFGNTAANAVPVFEIGRVLAPGGHWFLDYFNSDLILAELGDGAPRERLRQIECLQVKETRRFVAESNGVTKNVTKLVELNPLPGHEAAAERIGVGPSGLSYTEQVQLFQLSDLDRMAKAAGLKRVASAGSYEGGALGEGKRWILVYQKGEAASDGV